MIVVKHPYNPKTGERITVTYRTVDELPADEREIIAKLLAEK